MNPNLVSLHPSTFEQLQDSLLLEKLYREIEIEQNKRDQADSRITEKTMEIQRINEKYKRNK